MTQTSSQPEALQPVPFDTDVWAWEEEAPRVTEHLGRECVHLQSTIALAGIELEDGAIEADFLVSSERGFYGLVWRAQNEDNFETFYVRPHQVGNPDAVQYTPVFNGVSSWQLYHGPGFGAPISFPVGDWFRIRVVFAGARAEVFVGDLDEPGLVVAKLKARVEPGRVGLLASDIGPPVHVSRFAYDADVPLQAPAPLPAAALDGIVPAWSVSDAFAEDVVANALTLDADHLAALTWTELRSEPGGLADLSRVQRLGEGHDTVYARATIRSASAQTKRLDFGFSDRAIVYLNGAPLYRGDDAYQSRDYRFLGSIGYYDAVYLQLEEGENDLVIAVSEGFGGWGVQAKLTDLDGVSLNA